MYLSATTELKQMTRGSAAQREQLFHYSGDQVKNMLDRVFDQFELFFMCSEDLDAERVGSCSYASWMNTEEDNGSVPVAVPAPTTVSVSTTVPASTAMQHRQQCQYRQQCQDQ